MTEASLISLLSRRFSGLISTRARAEFVKNIPPEFSKLVLDITGLDLTTEDGLSSLAEVVQGHHRLDDRYLTAMGVLVDHPSIIQLSVNYFLRAYPKEVQKLIRFCGLASLDSSTITAKVVEFMEDYINNQLIVSET